MDEMQFNINISQLHCLQGLLRREKKILLKLKKKDSHKSNQTPGDSL